jgi:formiminotransferase-cyclodeaminase
MIDAIPDYTELPLGCFLDMVASREPAPGGGASAAVAVALAAALAEAGVRAAATLVEINVSAGGADGGRLSHANQLLAATVAAQEVVEGAEVQSSG